MENDAFMGLAREKEEGKEEFGERGPMARESKAGPSPAGEVIWWGGVGGFRDMNRKALAL